jgi:glyoxylase-like metal-dependent hydrolase (beta-lactamase superfamily II)
MTRVNTNFTFHNVGQGLFYSGEISSSQNIFRFIYDCGSFQRGLVYSAIKHFKNEIDKNNRVINLLILSHLHADHTSGLNDLFHYFKVEEVVLPYFTPIERLLIALRTVNMPGWYYKFLADPVPFLMERGVERIIIIGEREGGEEKAPPSEFPPPGERISSGINIKKLPDDENLKRTVFENDTNWQDIDELRESWYWT